ncbi:Six-hairpin glycosidase-like protein [Scleroderma yunnanense]
MNDGAAGDPASIGVAVLLTNWTGQGKVDGLDYAEAARDQLEFLLMNVPRTSDGAISHRTDEVQLWSDSVYMVPPFLAYYGAVTGNQTLLQEAYNQIKLYREYLRDEHANNMWKHIQLGSYGTDDGHWSTGAHILRYWNAWAAAGMLRVLGTIKHSDFANSMKSQQKDLANWVQEIHSGMYLHLDSSGLFHNYADDLSTFTDASSTALLASTVYRLSLLWGVHKHLPAAELCRRALSASMDSTINISASVTSSVSPPTSTSTSSSPSASSMVSGTNMPGMLHFTVDGWLTPVVDPYAFSNQGQTSPEGQAFVLAMQAAWRDWVEDGAKGANTAVGTIAPSYPRTVAQAVVAGVLPLVLEV